MTKANECTCPSGDGSLRHPCPAHPAVEQAGGDERAAFERAFTMQEGVYFDKKRGEYRSMNLRAIEASDAQDLNLRLQGWQARAALAQPSPAQADEKPGDSILCYGCFAKGVGPDHFDEAGKCLAVQAEQAEAERPEMSSERAAYFMRRFKSEEKLLGPNEQAAVDYVLSLIAQHERIVGDLQRQKHEADTALAWATRHYQTVEQERDAALAEVERLRQFERICEGLPQDAIDGGWTVQGIHAHSKQLEEQLKVALARVAELESKLAELEKQEPVAWMDPRSPEMHATISNEVKQHNMRIGNAPASAVNGYSIPLYAAPVAQAQHSVPEGWKPVPIEPLLNMMSDKDHDTRIMAERQLLSILAAEAQALREEVAQQKFLTKVENDALKMMTDKANELKSEVEQLEEELESLRTRVLVLPDASTVYAALDARERLFTSPENIQVALEAQSRINGKTVSEGLLRGMAAFSQEIISGALEGGSFDGADIQDSAERHGLIAKQVMNEPCRGPEEYCACAWSTSFPTECYRITAELRALLNQDKENGNG